MSVEEVVAELLERVAKLEEAVEKLKEQALYPTSPVVSDSGRVGA